MRSSATRTLPPEIGTAQPRTVMPRLASGLLVALRLQRSFHRFTGAGWSKGSLRRRTEHTDVLSLDYSSSQGLDVWLTAQHLRCVHRVSGYARLSRHGQLY